MNLRLLQAIHNNASWCETVCRTHRAPGEFLDDLWINRHVTPPFYPNAIALSKGQSADLYLKPIRDLIDAMIPKAWGVKDSFATLDLAPLGFQIVFEAEWIYRPASLSTPPIDLPNVEWIKLTRETELAEWESLWNGGMPNPTRIFLPALLSDEDVAIIAAYQDRKIIAGAIANRTGNVVGLSNIFLPTQDRQSFRAGCIAHALDLFPHLDLVGYESGIDLAEMAALGFELLGPLAIWEPAAVN